MPLAEKWDIQKKFNHPLLKRQVRLLDKCSTTIQTCAIKSQASIKTAST